MKNHINSFKLNLFIYYYPHPQIINAQAIKETAEIKNISLRTKLFLKYDRSIKVFFTSIIGPSIKNETTAPSGIVAKNVDATNASASEQSDTKKANNIIIKIATGVDP